MKIDCYGCACVCRCPFMCAPWSDQCRYIWRTCLVSTCWWWLSAVTRIWGKIVLLVSKLVNLSSALCWYQIAVQLLLWSEWHVCVRCCWLTGDKSNNAAVFAVKLAVVSRRKQEQEQIFKYSCLWVFLHWCLSFVTVIHRVRCFTVNTCKVNSALHTHTFIVILLPGGLISTIWYYKKRKRT